MQIGVCEQVLGTLAVTRLWALITLIGYVRLSSAHDLCPQQLLCRLLLAMPGIFWQSKADVSGGQQVLNAYQSQLSNVIVKMWWASWLVCCRMM